MPLLVHDHDLEIAMEWLGDNWFWLVIAILFVWMHAKMHGGHGSHGAGRPDEHGHRHERAEDSDA